MFKATQHINSTAKIRFRKFSGKRYAAFCSLNKEVSIGCVCAQICDIQLRKDGNGWEVNKQTYHNTPYYTENGWEWLELTSLETELCATTQANILVAAQAAALSIGIYEPKNGFKYSFLNI